MNAVRILVLVLVLVSIALTLLLAGATGLGVLLNRLLPEVGLGSGILIGVVALSVCLRVVLGLLGQAHLLREELDEAEMEDVVTVIHRPPGGRRSRR